MMSDIVEKTGVKYIDFSYDDNFSSEYKWFFDSNHLNRNGAGHFTSVLCREIANDEFGGNLEGGLQKWKEAVQWIFGMSHGLKH